MAWSAAATRYFAERAIDPLVAAELGVRENSHGLEFPYPCADGEQFSRTRSLNGAAAKVRQPAGTRLCPWQPVPNGKAHEAIVCEGESDLLAAVSALRRSPIADLRDLPVVAVPGTGCPADRVVEQLVGEQCRQVWLALDGDDAGRRYTEKLITELVVAGIKPFVVELPEGRDLADCLAAEAEDQRGEWIANVLYDAEAAAEERESHVPPIEATDLNGDGRRLVLTDLAGVRPRPVSWLWSGRAPLGALTLVAGKPKLGKSTLAYDLAAKVSTGALDGDLHGSAANVLIVTYEDLIAETVVPRLMAAGGDLARIQAIEAERDGERDLVSLPDDVARIEHAAIQTGARLLIIDPLMAALTGGIDSHRDSQVRRVLAPLAKLAEGRDLAVLTVCHLNKGQGADLIGRIGGSVAFTAAARSLLVWAADPQDSDGDDGNARVLAQRGNLARRAPSLAYRIEGRLVDGPDGSIETSRLVYLGESDARADELLAAAATSEERTERDEAAEFLRTELADGPRPAGEIKTAARAAGISEITLRRAKAKLGVESGRVGGAGTAGHWQWSLRRSPPPDHLRESEGDHLRANPLPERNVAPIVPLRRSPTEGDHLRPVSSSDSVPRCSCLRPSDVTLDGRCSRCLGAVPPEWRGAT